MIFVNFSSKSLLYTTNTVHIYPIIFRFITILLHFHL